MGSGDELATVDKVLEEVNERLERRSVSASVAEQAGSFADVLGGRLQGGQGCGAKATATGQHHDSIEHVLDGRVSSAGASCLATRTLRTWLVFRRQRRGLSLLAVARGWS